MSVDLVILGGFLGSGKTTLMLKLAEQYSAEGLKVALITNDQGDILVDTETAKSRGFATGQVSSGCFCCHFSEFMDNVEEFLEKSDPDLIIAEPVGSCTDLVSTLAAPIQNYYSEKVNLKGIFVLVDGQRLVGSWNGLDLENPVTPEEVLLSHQICEAGSIFLSKTDLLTPEKESAAVDRLSSLNSSADIQKYSAMYDEDTLRIGRTILNSTIDDLVLRSVELDYDVYAQAEAELGWYNGSWEYKSETVFSLSDYLLELSDLFQRKELGKVSHGKIFLLSEDSSIKLSFVEGVIRSDVVQSGKEDISSCRTILNIRSKSSPSEIENVVNLYLKILEDKFQGDVSAYERKSLIPSPPEPEHRIRISHEL